MIILQITEEQLSCIVQNAVRMVTEEKTIPHSHYETEAPLTISQAAKLLNLSVTTLYGYTTRKEIPFSKPKKQLYFSREELLTWAKCNHKKTFKEASEEVAAETDSFLSSIKNRKKKNNRRISSNKKTH